MNHQDHPWRGTGRTTALLFQSIAQAIMAHGEPVPVFDHEPFTYASAKWFARQLRVIATQCSISVSVVADRQAVTIRSTAGVSQHQEPTCSPRVAAIREASAKIDARIKAKEATP